MKNTVMVGQSVPLINSYATNGESLKALLYLLIILFTGCSQESTRISDEKRIEIIKFNFQNNIKNYELLGKMIKHDFQGKECFTVGLDRIDTYWYEKIDKIWSTSQTNHKEKKLSLNKLLQKFSIPMERYETYKKLFSETNTERATFCNINNIDSYHLLTFRRGQILTGCSIEINKKLPSPTAYKKQDKYDSFEIIPLKDGWYIEYECS